MAASQIPAPACIVRMLTKRPNYRRVSDQRNHMLHRMATLEREDPLTEEKYVFIFFIIKKFDIYVFSVDHPGKCCSSFMYLTSAL